jgi:hypothetical protein
MIFVCNELERLGKQGTMSYFKAPSLYPPRWIEGPRERTCSVRLVVVWTKPKSEAFSIHLRSVISSVLLVGLVCWGAYLIQKCGHQKPEKNKINSNVVLIYFCSVFNDKGIYHLANNYERRKY